MHHHEKSRDAGNIAALKTDLAGALISSENTPTVAISQARALDSTPNEPGILRVDLAKISPLALQGCAHVANADVRAFGEVAAEHARYVASGQMTKQKAVDELQLIAVYTSLDRYPDLVQRIMAAAFSELTEAAA